MTDYDPTIWVNGVAPAINSTNLNKMEGGIDTAHSELTTHEADNANPHSVTKTQVGLGDVANIKVKLDATTAPTVTDDSDAGYGVQSRWTDVTLDKEYVCLDASVGVAVWLEIGAAHDLGGVSHNADTLANLNSKISDATLIDTADSRLSDNRDPTAHATEHVDGTDDIRDATNVLKGVATAAQITALEANSTHRISDGSDHTFIDQSVINGASPIFNGANITNVDADTLIVDVKEAGVSAVTKGQMCAIVGSSGAKFEVQLCDCDDAALIRVLGLVAVNTAQNETGQVIYKGLLTNVNSQIGNTDVNPNGETWLAGDLLFVSTTPGGLTNVRPSSGRCIKAGRTLKGNSASDTFLAIINTNSICACAAAGEDICSRMGDNDGVNKHGFKDYADNEVAAIDSNGNLTLIGNVDGRDVGTDGTKLDTVEENAAADQNASEVPITDVGSIITATDVEDALQENRTAINLNTAKVTNVSTDLSEGTNTETTVDVNSSDGSNATLVSASTLRAGLLTKAKFDEIVANTAKVTNATHTGDATGSVALTIAADAVTYGKMQNIVNDERILGRVSGADGVVEELTKAQVLSMLSVEDGADVTDTTNVTSAGAFMDSEFPYQSFTNLLKSGDFESWSAGAAAAPEGWLLVDGGTGATVVREATIIKHGTYSAKLSNGDSYTYIREFITPYTYYKSKTVTFGAWVYASVATRVNLKIDDVVSNSASAWHTGDSTWQFLTVTHTVSASATALSAWCIIESGTNTSAYFDGAILVEGSVCPAFSPHPTDQIPIVLTSAPTDAGTNGETRWYAIAGAGGARRLYMSNGTDWKYIAIAT